MRIRQEKTIDRCRFCFMCRHVCSVARVTHEEGVTPRSQGLVMSLINRDAATPEPDVIKNIYDCTQCRWCREWCEGGWDFSACIVAAREALREENLVPAAVRDRIDRLAGQPRPEAQQTETLILAEPTWVDGAAAQTGQAEAILSRAGIACAATTAPSPVFALYALGARAEATASLSHLISAIRDSGCRTVVALSPADVFALRELPAILDVTALPESMTVISWADQVQTLIQSKRLAPKPVAAAFTWHDDDFSARYTHETAALPAILKLIPEATVADPTWKGNHAHSSGGASCGCSDPAIIAKLASQRLSELQATGAGRIITATADDAALLARSAQADVSVETLTELVASWIK